MYHLRLRTTSSSGITGSCVLLVARDCVGEANWREVGAGGDWQAVG